MQKLKYTWTVAWTLVSFMSYSPQVRPQPTQVNNPSQVPYVEPPPSSIGEPKRVAIGAASRLHFVDPPLPPTGVPAGGHPLGTGSRCTECPTVTLPLTALVPEEKLSQGKAVWARTVNEHPTFWFYVPYSPASLHHVEFVLQDGEDDVYRTLVTLPQTPGIVSLRLPSTLKPLEIGRNYHWFLKTYFALQKPSAPDYVDGWVQRVALSPIVTARLKATTPQERVALYANNGIWYDALTVLAELRLVHPEDATLKVEWNDLLHSIGLTAIAPKPLVQCCVPVEKLTQQ